MNKICYAVIKCAQENAEECINIINSNKKPYDKLTSIDNINKKFYYDFKVKTKVDPNWSSTGKTTKTMTTMSYACIKVALENTELIKNILESDSTDRGKISRIEGICQAFKQNFGETDPAWKLPFKVDENNATDFEWANNDPRVLRDNQ